MIVDAPKSASANSKPKRLEQLTGRKVKCELGNRPNLYILGLAASGAGKEQSRRINKRLLYEIGAADLIGNERVGSHAGIITAVSEKPSVLFQLDEIGHLFASMKPSAKSSAYLSQIASVLLHLYSSSDDTWVGDAYAHVLTAVEKCGARRRKIAALGVKKHQGLNNLWC